MRTLILVLALATAAVAAEAPAPATTEVLELRKMVIDRDLAILEMRYPELKRQQKELIEELAKRKAAEQHKKDHK